MFGVFLANHTLDVLGTYLVIITAVKIARGYPVRRWFF
jgi:hypothetical protein